MLYKKFIIPILFTFVFSGALEAQDDTSKFKTQTIEVNSIRAIDRLTPITFENISHDKIEKKYWVQDLPMFLNGNTSVNAYSESGGSIGYSYFSIRGFDQRRISILMNGIPQNDAEDHQVYWVDLSDITSSVEDIQVQRGIGTALYGTSSIGGAINIKTVDFFKRKFISANAGYGSYDSKKFSVEYSSGLLENGFGFYAKYSKLYSDGYRDFSWSNHWSYFISAGKQFGSNTVIKFNVYGSPIQNHLAYYGVTKDYLDGKISGDVETDRKVNSMTYQNETDNYYQPHYEFVINSQISKNIFLSNTLNYIRGDGYFVTSYPASWGYDYSYFHLQPFYTFDSTAFNSGYYKRNSDGTLVYDPQKGYAVVRSDLITKLFVNNNDYGWYPKIQISHSADKGLLVIGAEVRLHNSEHWGEISSGNVLPQGTPPDFKFYSYDGKKTTVSGFANEIFEINKKLALMGGVQFVTHTYKLEKNLYSPYNFSVNYNFLTPRIGVNYNFSDKLHAFANFSMSKREPRLKDIYNAEDPYAKPNFRIIDTLSGKYEDPLVKPEEMLDYEAGIEFKSSMLRANLNLYWMDFRNEIVSNGQLDNVGQPINANAGKSVHRGIEMNFEYFPFANKSSSNLLSQLSLSGNLTLSQNFFKEYRELLGTDSTGAVIYGNDYSDNKILLSPDVIGNLSLNYQTSFGLGLNFSMQYISRQYLDNTENERKNPEARLVSGYVEKFIAPYTVCNAAITYDLASTIKNNIFKTIKIRFLVNNIFDRLYETTGSVDSYGTPYWIPAAERNFYLDLILGF